MNGITETPLRNVADLEARVSRATAAANGNDREKQLTAQVQWLADRLALALSFIHDVSLDVEFEKEADEPNRFSEAYHTALSDHQIFEELRQKRRGTVFFETATNDIRQSLRRATK